MKEVLQFLAQNWQLVASAVLFIIATVIGIVRLKKKGYTLPELMNGLILEQIPMWISLAESIGGKGESKRVQVLNEALSYCAKKLGRTLTQEESDYIISYVSEQVENILATPQKKEARKRGK